MTLMEKEIFEVPETLKTCLKTNEKLFEELAEKLSSSKIKNVVVAARGTSDHAGTYGKYIIESLVGIPVSLAAMSVVTRYGATLDLSDSVVLAISQSGKAADVIEYVEMAKESGAIIVTITNDNTSPLSLIGDYNFFLNVGEEKSVAATKTFSAQIYTIAHIVAMWADRKDILAKLDKVPEKICQILLRNEEIATLAIRYRFMKEAFILSRGVNYPLALEGALKIQETNYVLAKAYPISDFHHGPFAMVEEGMPVIMYISAGPVAQDSMDMIKKLQAVGADLLMVTDDEDLLAESDVGFQLPFADKEDMIASFYYATFAQLFACNLAEVKGRNPDAPRGLNKVTITK